MWGGGGQLGGVTDVAYINTLHSRPSVCAAGHQLYDTTLQTLTQEGVGMDGGGGEVADAAYISPLHP